MNVKNAPASSAVDRSTINIGRPRSCVGHTTEICKLERKRSANGRRTSRLSFRTRTCVGYNYQSLLDDDVTPRRVPFCTRKWRAGSFEIRWRPGGRLRTATDRRTYRLSGESCCICISSCSFRPPIKSVHDVFAKIHTILKRPTTTTDERFRTGR